jgi:hypothetical protein
MSYVCRFLQFGWNDKGVPGYDKNPPEFTNAIAPIPPMLIDPVADPAHPLPKDIWGLVFSFTGGEFYKADGVVPGQPDGSTIRSWYSQGGPGPNSFCVNAFVVDGSGQLDGFVAAPNLVSFSEPAVGTCINTDAIAHPTATGTVELDIPELARSVTRTESTNYAVIITTTTTRVVFDHRFVILSGEVVNTPGAADNSLTVAKGHSCLALAIYKVVTTSASHEIGTAKKPKIPKQEWPMLAERFAQHIAERQGELFEFVSPSVLVNTPPEELKRAAADIGKRVQELERVKAVITDLAERTR